MIFLILKIKVILSVVVGDIFDHPANPVHLALRKLPIFDIPSDDVAEDAAEILVTGVADETAGVREHAHEAAQQPQHAQRVELLAHAVLLIEEPPAAAELHHSGIGAVIEGVGHRRHDLVVLGIEAIEDGLGQFARLGEPVQELVPCGGRRQVVDGIVARIGPELAEHPAVVVADGAYVELLRPAALGVHYRHVEEEGAAELVEFVRIGRLSCEDLGEDALNFGGGIIGGIEGFQPVVGKFAAHRGEEIVTLLQGFEQVGVAADFHHQFY